MRITDVELQNFRAFETTRFEFADQFSLIIGDNATGKTSVLESVTIALSHFVQGLVPNGNCMKWIDAHDVRQKFFLHGSALTVESQFPAAISTGVAFPDGKSDLLSIRNEGAAHRTKLKDGYSLAKTFADEVQSGSDRLLPLISYYGTERLRVQIGRTNVKTNGPQSRLAGYDDCLNSASDQKRLLEWFKTQEFISLQQQRQLPILEACRDAISKCIPDASRVYFDVAYDELVAVIDGKGIPFSYLSDGFRSMLALVADIAVRCATLNPQLEANAATETAGVVLIDELDLHLHPNWQRRVVTDLMRVFPKIQFIATTHSPFVIQSLPPHRAAKLINLDSNEPSSYVSSQSVEDIAETVQGVELPQRSLRYLEMMEKAKSYFTMLENDDEIDSNEKESKRRELEELVRPFSDNPGYHAFLKLKQLTSENGSNQRSSP